VKAWHGDTRGGAVEFPTGPNVAPEAGARAGGVGLGAGKWSNANRTYTELGVIVAGSSGYGVLLASERSVSNSLTTEAINQSRNLAFLPLSQDFETIDQAGYVVPSGMIAAGGVDSEPFGFYDYGGRYVSQQNRNVRWLTRYRDKDAENASRAKMIRMKDKSLLVVWEKWTEFDHVSTHAMKIDALASIRQARVNIGAVRPSPGDRPRDASAPGPLAGPRPQPSAPPPPPRPGGNPPPRRGGRAVFRGFLGRVAGKAVWGGRGTGGAPGPGRSRTRYVLGAAGSPRGASACCDVVIPYMLAGAVSLSTPITVRRVTSPVWASRTSTSTGSNVSSSR